MKSEALKKGFVFLFLLIFAIAGISIAVSFINPESAYARRYNITLPGMLGTLDGTNISCCTCPNPKCTCACVISFDLPF